MKRKLFFLLLIFCISTQFSFAQQKLAAPDKKYAIKLKDVWSKENGYKKDTIITDEASFKIMLDTTGVSPAVVKSIELQVPGDRREVKDTIEKEEFKIGKDSLFAFTFLMAEAVEYTDTIKTEMILLRLKNPADSTQKDSLVKKAELLKHISALSKSFLVIAQKDTTVTSTLVKTMYKNDKQVSVYFKRKGEPASAFATEMENFKSEVRSLFAEASVKKSIGSFTLLNNFITVYTEKDSVVKKKKFLSKKERKSGATKIVTAKKLGESTAEVQSLNILVSNGAIAKNGVMLELSNDSIYRNNKAPISLYKFRKRTGDRIWLQIDGVDKFVKIGELVNYKYSGKFHYPDNDSVMLSPKRKTDSLYNLSTINDLIDITLYSDLLGLIGRKPNGIIQTQLSANFTTNTTNSPNADIVPFAFIKPYFRLAKYDSRFSQADTTILDTAAKTIKNRLFMTQVAYLQAGLKLNLVRIGLGANHQLQLNAGADVNLTSADSLLKMDITTVNYYPELEYKVNGPENFGMEASVRYLLQVVSKNIGFGKPKNTWIFNPQVLIYYSSPSNPSSKIYLRYSNYAEIGGGKNNFGQFQFGYKTALFKNKINE